MASSPTKAVTKRVVSPLDLGRGNDESPSLAVG
jgi:hypothetical protein